MNDGKGMVNVAPFGRAFQGVKATIVAWVVERKVHEAAAEEAIPIVESHGIRVLFVACAHVPFPNSTGDVVLFLQKARNGINFRKALLGIEREGRVFVETESRLVSPGEKAGT